MIGRMPRRIEPEQMDAAPPEVAAGNLRDLIRINRWLGGHWLLPRIVRAVAEPDEALRVLDVGAASGDMGEALRRRFPRARVLSLDRMLRNLAAAPPPKVVADAAALPFAPGTFDIVMGNLFLHHFEDREAVLLLREMARVAARAVVILDLWRHPLARAFLPATSPLLGWHRLTVEDGMASVAAGFLPDELARLGAEAGFGAVRTQGHLPWFRVSLVARLDGGNLLT